MSFTLDWAAVDIDGSTTLTDGASDIAVTISTPENHRGESWKFGFPPKTGPVFDGDSETIRSSNVKDSVELQVAFDREVSDLSFEIYDIDSGHRWDDKVTVRAFDADGNEVEVIFSDLERTHDVDGNTIEAEGNFDTGIDGSGARDSVTVEFAGPVQSLVIIHDNGDDYHKTGTIGLSDWHFSARDGIVTGTDGNDSIVADEFVDDDGDEIDNDDAIIPGDGPNDDRVEAGDGDDTVDPGEGNDTVYGGEGNDEIRAGSLGRPDLGYPGLFPGDDDPNDDRDLFDGGAGDDDIFGGDDDDTLIGGTGRDTIDGGFDRDDIDAGEGDDSVIGGEGSDTILGGAGNDTIFGGIGLPDDAINIIDDPAAAPPAPDLVPDNGRDLLDGGDGDDVIFGEDDDDTLLGGDGNDALDAGIDDDSVEGGAGNDTITGGQGVDTLLGGDDRDVFIGGNGGDSIVGGEGGDDFDTLDLSGTGPATILFTSDDREDGIVVFESDGSILTFEEIENIVPPPGGSTDRDGIVEGTEAGDLIDINYDGDPDGDFVDNNDALLPGEVGNDDIILAKGGEDTIIAALGNDEVFAGDGDDEVSGGEGDDRLVGMGGDDLLEGDAGNDALSGGVGNDTLDGGEGGDTVFGGLGNDEIIGGSGNDLVDAGSGNDTLTGGADADTLSGGDDEDTFIVTSAQNDGNDLIFGGSGGSDFDTIDTRAIGLQGVDWDLEDVVTDSDGNGIDGTLVFLDGGDVSGRLRFENIEDITVICFTPGTRIATPKGEVLAEQLTAGDKVLTRDNGVQEIAWYGQTGLNAADFQARPHLAPIHIKAGALGNGLPERDMMVSPQHRVLVSSERAAYYFDEREVLVAAKHLVNGDTIVQKPVPQTAYIHFMCESHEIVLSNGAWTESFQPGDFSLNGIGDAQRDEILELFPELATETGLKDYAAARRSLKRHEAVVLMR